MGNETLKKWLEAGFPHLRQAAQLPPWLLPREADLAGKLGDEEMVYLVEPLGLAEQARGCLAVGSDVEFVSAEVWEAVIGGWGPAEQVSPIALALLQAQERIRALRRQGDVGIEHGMVIRSLAVFSCAPFVSQGRRILTKVASILGGTPEEPAALIGLYIEEVARGNSDAIAGIDKCIGEDATWGGWSQRFLEKLKEVSYVPKVVGVAPPATRELVRTLAIMLQEGTGVDDNGHP